MKNLLLYACCHAKAQAHLLLYACCHAKAQAHLLLYACCHANAQAHLLLYACCLFAAVPAFAAKLNLSTADKEMEFRAELDKTNLDEKIKGQLFSAYVDYNAASAKFKELMELNGLNKVKPKSKSINADVTDPTLKAIRKQVTKTHNRFETLKRTINKWGPSTNLTARAAGASFQDKLNAARAYEKQVKAIQKAAKKDGKNLGKLRKDLEKYRDKAETDGFKELCQGLLDMLPVPNDGN